MNSIKDISIETVGVADYCPVCKTSTAHGAVWAIEVEEESLEETHLNEPKGSQIGRSYIDYAVVPNTAKLVAFRERGEFGFWIDA